jgi:hypothetical protein
MRLKLGVVLAGLIAIGLIAAGCGGDDDDGGGDGEALSKEEFVTQARQICDDAKGETDQVFQQAEQQVQANPGNLQQVLSDVIGDVIPILRDTVNQIGELTPPEELQGTLDEYVTGANAAFDEIEADPQAFFQRASGGEEAFPELEQQAAELGITDCLDTGTGDESGTSTTPTTTAP